ncbi:hypothetical protein E2C01_011570 [Portunus trituberculatus]|uniref:Uncharacterized protein n=1 Tax=Portunus trituberculatus TaxID=210409 RepID=A0A5B7DBS6_PORTR|nr:hypothetical protein [Portunus trituberculatus]
MPHTAPPIHQHHSSAFVSSEEPASTPPSPKVKFLKGLLNRSGLPWRGSQSCCDVIKGFLSRHDLLKIF